jgi:hypothetical protein
VWRDAPVNTIPSNPLAILQLAIRRKPSGAFTGKLPFYLVEGESATGENPALKNNFLDHASPFALRIASRACFNGKSDSVGLPKSEIPIISSNESMQTWSASSKSGAEAMRFAVATAFGLQL